MKSGVDRSIVYVREEKAVAKGNGKYEGSGDIRVAVIGFCGKTYPLAYTFGRDAYDNNFIKTFYEIEKLKILLETNNKLWLDINYDSNIKVGTNKRSNRWTHLNALFDHYNRDNFTHKWFTQYNVPIFVWQPKLEKLTLNGLLGPWEFYRIFDPWTAFQELAMFLSNELAPKGKIIPVMKDSDLAEIKGFDKYSFRKDKQTK